MTGELPRLELADKRTELVRGQLVVREPAGYRHGEIAARLLAMLFNFVESRALGRVLTAETGFVLRRNPDTVRAADVAFVRRERFPVPPPNGFAASGWTTDDGRRTTDDGRRTPRHSPLATRHSPLATRHSLPATR
jgi:Uma2 family endonuclease